MGTEYNYDEEIAYVADRVIKEGSVPSYIEKVLGDKKSVDELGQVCQGELFGSAGF